MNLWVCHKCALIGTQAEALAHADISGHDIEDLGGPMSAQVREEQRRQRIERAAAFVSFGRVHRGNLFAWSGDLPPDG